MHCIIAGKWNWKSNSRAGDNESTIEEAGEVRILFTERSQVPLIKQVDDELVRGA